jgi:hypothetical protein
VVKRPPGLLLALAIAAVLVIWVVFPLLRARVYLATGSPLRAWAAALQTEDSGARDDILVAIMQQPALSAEGEATTIWSAYLQGDWQVARDAREPAWVQFGPHGKQVMAFVQDLGSWPWLHCGLPAVERSAELKAWRWVEYGAGDAGRRAAEMEAFSVAHEMAQEVVLIASKLRSEEIDEEAEDVALRVSVSVAHMAAAAAAEIQATGGVEMLLPTMLALRSGHAPRPEDGTCAGCTHWPAPAPGVEEGEDGTLRWTDPQGLVHSVDSFLW